MATLNLGSVTLDEVKRSANSAYAASIISGEIHSVACRHSKNGNVVLVIEGKALSCKGFNGDSFVVDGCFLYNPPLTRAIVEACNGDDASIFIVKGAVSTTAPATVTSDTVVPKEELEKAIDAELRKLKKDLALEDNDAKISELTAQIDTLNTRKKALKNA